MKLCDIFLFASYEMLPLEEQLEIANQIGTTRSQILSNLTDLSLGTSFLWFQPIYSQATRVKESIIERSQMLGLPESSNLLKRLRFKTRSNQPLSLWAININRRVEGSWNRRLLLCCSSNVIYTIEEVLQSMNGHLSYAMRIIN